jgi:hypothetical protein
MKRSITGILILFATILLAGCHCHRNAIEEKPDVPKSVRPATAVSAPILVYKTKKDYAQYIPVIMDKEKTRIVSYPDPSDVYYEGKLAYPTPLENGYLLDNRGIGPNVAFLNYTYEAYSRLKTAPTMEQLMNSMLDKNPLLELWNCGQRNLFKNEIQELNLLIEKGFPGCRQLVKAYQVELRK